MTKAKFRTFIEKEINTAAKRIPKKGETYDEIAFGKLNFFLALRRKMDNMETPEDIGLFGAINDALQKLEVLESSETFLGGLKP